MRCCLCVFLFILCAATQANERFVSLCDNDEPYPPFRWTSKDGNGFTRTHGFGLKLVSDLLYKHDFRFRVDFMPLSRCLREVQSGENYQIVLSSSRSEHRDQNYLVTEPYYFVKMHAFYLKSAFPQGLNIQNDQTLGQYSLCGVKGHNFTMFKVPESQFDFGAPNIATALEKVKKGRCQVFPYNIEVVLGHTFTGVDLLSDKLIEHTPLAYHGEWPLVMLITKNSPHSAELKRLIDLELKALRESGELEIKMQRFIHLYQK